MTPKEFKTFREVHGHNSHRVYKAFEEGEVDIYATVDEAIDHAIAAAYEDAASEAEAIGMLSNLPRDCRQIAYDIAAAIRAKARHHVQT